MSYDLIFTPTDDNHLDPVRWESIVTGVRDILGEVTTHQEGDERGLSHEQTGIQLSCRPGSAGLTVPFWYTGAEAEAIVVALYRIAQVVSDAGGMDCLDPQLDLPLAEAKTRPDAAVAVFDRVGRYMAEMRMESFHVYFSGEATLADAASRLKGVLVAEEPDRLTVRWGADGPQMWVTLSSGTAIAADADALAEAHGIPQLAGLDRCFRVSVEDLDEALDEINTLIEVQAHLQELTGGYVAHSWNDQIGRPEN